MASRRQYLTQTELAEYADITVSDATEADDRISQAEELIDAFVGYVEKFLQNERRFFGIATSSTSTTLVDTSTDSNLDDHDDNFFAGCEVEIIGGTGNGQRFTISSSDKSAGSITINTTWTTSPDTTSAYRIYQLGKFPRRKDVFYDDDNATYYKSIPEVVRRATAAQVQFMIEMGDEFFSGAPATFNSENLGNYSYSAPGNQNDISRLVAPKAKQMLLQSGITKRAGKLFAANITKL